MPISRAVGGVPRMILPSWASWPVRPRRAEGQTVEAPPKCGSMPDAIRPNARRAVAELPIAKAPPWPAAGRWRRDEDDDRRLDFSACSYSQAQAGVRACGSAEAEPIHCVLA